MLLSFQVICDRIDQATVSKEFGIALIGLYGVGGIGKTTVCQTLCNEYFKKMEGRVFHAELGSVDDLELLQGALKRLTDKSHDLISGLNKSQVWYAGICNSDMYTGLIYREMYFCTSILSIREYHM